MRKGKRLLQDSTPSTRDCVADSKPSVSVTMLRCKQVGSTKITYPSTTSSTQIAISEAETASVAWVEVPPYDWVEVPASPRPRTDTRLITCDRNGLKKWKMRLQSSKKGLHATVRRDHELLKVRDQRATQPRVEKNDPRVLGSTIQLPSCNLDVHAMERKRCTSAHILRQKCVDSAWSTPRLVF